MKEDLKAGYPAKDRPWEKFYPKEALDMTVPKWGLFENVYESNKNDLENTALTYFGKRISYGELFDSTASAMDMLKSFGVSKGDIVSVITVITPEFVYLLYACNMLGAVINIIDPRLSAGEKAEKINNTETKVLAVLDACMDDLETVEEKTTCLRHIVVLPVKRSMGTAVKIGYTVKNLFKKRCHDIGKRRILWDECFKLRPYNNEKSLDFDPYAPAAIFYTGGTTGEAKGVLLSTYNMNSVPEQFKNLSGGFKKGESWLTLSMPFVAYATICSLHIPLSWGLNCFIELYNIPNMVRSILKNRIKHISATPLMYAKLADVLNRHKRDVSFLEMPISGGDKLNATMYQKINEALMKNGCTWKVCSGYGMTEASSAVCVSCKGNSNKPGSAGIPLPLNTISAFDVETGVECKTGEKGELRICGPTVMMGYYKNPEKTDEIIKTDKQGNRWICTGDYGYVDEDGCVFVLERIKRLLIKFDSFKVFPVHVEEAALKSEYVSRCCCVGIPDEVHKFGEVPVLFAVLKDSVSKEDAFKDIKEKCRKGLAEYSRPAKIEIVEALPITHAGKIDYHALERLALEA